ncbi:MAG TPA: glycosyltransferase family 4 protein [Longimicrobium sp.]|nr:glycosyltransferase family 4 protein [Longimicrobium sp.]
MRLVIATTFRRFAGGIETYLRTLLPELSRRGFDVALLHELSPPAGVPLIDERLPGLPVWDAQAMGLPAAVDAVRAFRPDLIFQQGLVTLGLEEALLDAGPNALFAHVYHGGCISGFKSFALPTPRPCDRDFGPACLGLYLPRRCGGLSPRTMLREYRLHARRRELLSRYRAVVVASRRLRREYTPAVLPPERVVLAPIYPGGVTPDAQPPAPRPPTGRVLMVGRLTSLKGGGVLVRAVALASRKLGRPLELDLAGDGPDRGRLEALARKHGVAARFHGWVPDAVRDGLLRASDVVAVPSTWPEPFGMVGVEAGCVGVPAVAFEVGGIPDWLEPGVSGELAPSNPPTAEGLAEALVRALRDEGHWQRLREGAWHAARRFTPEAHLDILTGALRAAAGLSAAAPGVASAAR